MDAPLPTKEDCKQTFRKANKILNLWIKQKLPFTNLHLLQEKYREYELIKLQNKLIAPDFGDLVTPEQQEFSVDLTNALSQIRLEAKPRPSRFIKKSDVTSMTGNEYVEMRLTEIEQNTRLSPEEKDIETENLVKQTEKWLSKGGRQGCLHASKVDAVITSGDAFIPYDMFKLYLYPEDKDDDEIEVDINNLKIEQKRVLKKIKNIINNLSTYDLRELSHLDKLFLKIISLLNYSQFELNHELDFEILENWAKIGLWLIERSCQTSNLKSWELKAIKPITKYIQKVITPLVALIYGQLAYFLSMSNKSEKMFSEKLLEITRSLQEKFVVTPQTHQTIKLINTICLCTQAKIFLDSNQITQFIATLNEALQLNYRYSTNLFKILYLAGKHFCEHSPDSTKVYFEHALTLLNDANARELSLEENFHQEIKSFLSDYKKNKLIEMQSEITKIFPFCGVGMSKERLNVFLYLDEVPYDAIKLPSNSAITELKKYKQKPHKNKILTGFRFYTDSLDIKAVVLAIHKLLQQIEKTLNLESARKAVQPGPLMLHAKPLIFQEIPKPVKIASLTEPQSARVKQKKKTRGTTTATKQENLKIQPPLKTLKKFASDYGFKLGGDNLVSPVFFSQAHKNRGNPQIVVCWDDHKCLNLDNEVIRKFKALFDCEGVVQARKVNEPGFKIIAGPNNQWVVRGKLEGVGDSTRVYFKPKETIKTDDGDEITLYKLKKKINK